MNLDGNLFGRVPSPGTRPRDVFPRRRHHAACASCHAFDNGSIASKSGKVPLVADRPRAKRQQSGCRGLNSSCRAAPCSRKYMEGLITSQPFFTAGPAACAPYHSINSKWLIYRTTSS
ncbi:hypothetical protein CO660_12835 [Rhizobium sp. L9]|nr:hypothetical protein CO660_12835 [Rhizobium sp. L9]